MKYFFAFMLMLINMSQAMSYGKVVPTNIQRKTAQCVSGLIVKTISQLAEFTDLVSQVDDTRRFLELREGIIQAKTKHFTFKCMCGPSYSSVFGLK